MSGSFYSSKSCQSPFVPNISIRKSLTTLYVGSYSWFSWQIVAATKVVKNPFPNSSSEFAMWIFIRAEARSCLTDQRLTYFSAFQRTWHSIDSSAIHYKKCLQTFLPFLRTRHDRMCEDARGIKTVSFMILKLGTAFQPTTTPQVKVATVL